MNIKTKFTDFVNENYNSLSLSDIIERLNKYSIEYKNNGNIKFSNVCSTIIEYLENNDYKNALTLYRTSELLYDIGNTYDALKKLDIEDYISKNFDANWCLIPGEYIAYRAGSVENTKNGIFFSISEGGAEAYSDSERKVNKYKVKIRYN